MAAILWSWMFVNDHWHNDVQKKYSAVFRGKDKSSAVFINEFDLKYLNFMKDLSIRIFLGIHSGSWFPNPPKITSLGSN